MRGDTQIAMFIKNALFCQAFAHHDSFFVIANIFPRAFFLASCGAQIPVVKGADRPFHGNWEQEKLYFGTDNFGDVARYYQVGPNTLKGDHTAALQLLKMVREKPGQLTLVQLGPLTNLAIALLVDPDFTKDVKEIFVLGGNFRGKHPFLFLLRVTMGGLACT